MPNGLSSGFTNTFRLRSAHYVHAVAIKTFACSYEPRLENTYSQSFDRRVQCWQMPGRCGWSTAIRRHVSSLSGRSLPTSIWPEGVTTDSYWRWVGWTSRSSAADDIVPLGASQEHRDKMRSNPDLLRACSFQKVPRVPSGRF